MPVNLYVPDAVTLTSVPLTVIPSDVPLTEAPLSVNVTTVSSVSSAYAAGTKSESIRISDSISAIGFNAFLFILFLLSRLSSVFP